MQRIPQTKRQHKCYILLRPAAAKVYARIEANQDTIFNIWLSHTCFPPEPWVAGHNTSLYHQARTFWFFLQPQPVFKHPGKKKKKQQTTKPNQNLTTVDDWEMTTYIIKTLTKPHQIDNKEWLWKHPLFTQENNKELVWSLKFRRNNILFSHVELWGHWTYMYMSLLAILGNMDNKF